MIKLFFNLAESAAVVRAIINQVVTAVLLKCQTTDHIRMTEQFIVCLILNPDFKTILEIITTSTIRFAIDIMLQIKIGCAVNTHQDVKGHIIILDLRYAHIGVSNDLDYTFQSSTNRNSDEIIVSSVVINQEVYDLIWFNGAQTEYAELLYTVGNQPQEPQKFNTNDMSIICVRSPAKEYTISVSYYDHNGNKYKANKRAPLL